MIYDETNHCVLEIAFHPEPKLTGSKTINVLHYHTYDYDFHRSEACLLTEAMYHKFSLYFKKVGK